jgi:hypothetical protein
MTAAMLSQSVAPGNALESPHDPEEEEDDGEEEVDELRRPEAAGGWGDDFINVGVATAAVPPSAALGRPLTFDDSAGVA